MSKLKLNNNETKLYNIINKNMYNKNLYSIDSENNINRQYYCA